MKFARPAALLALCTSLHAAPKWIEAESFTNPGGWVLDTQFIDIMGSPYLMAHGMGKPVKDAETEIELLELIARQRAFMRKGGLADLHKASEILVNEFRAGFLGRISLETPEMVSAEIVLAAEEAEQKAKEKAEREEERQARARRKYAKKRQK